MIRAHHITRCFTNFIDNPSNVALAAIGAGCIGLALSGLMIHVQVTPCPTEDSTWCYWDATSRGNGNGESFIALWEGATIYLP